MWVGHERTTCRVTWRAPSGSNTGSRRTIKLARCLVVRYRRNMLRFLDTLD